jgi:hypothetical protein
VLSDDLIIRDQAVHTQRSTSGCAVSVYCDSRVFALALCL